MRPYRDLKIGSVIQEELGKILIKDFEFAGAFATIVGVEVSPDLLQARIKMSVIPENLDLPVFRALEERKREFQHKLLKKMNIRPMPHIKFEIEKQENKEFEIEN